MILTVNDTAHQTQANTLAELLAEIGAPVGSGAAVAVGGVVVPSREWEHRTLSAGETVDVLVAAQGG